VRIIAATNRDLEHMITTGDFREDLYYRIHVLSVRLPCLRERTQCIEPLAKSLLLKTSHSLGKRVDGFSPAAMAVLQAGSWPGNIRQLANTIERAAILTESALIDEDCLPALNPAPKTAPKTAPAAARTPLGEPTSLALQEKETIIKVLDECLWIQKDAAQSLGISPRALNYKIKKYEITHPRWRKHRG
jgi:DNA-binding NtrC family response regulator